MVLVDLNSNLKGNTMMYALRNIVLISFSSFTKNVSKKYIYLAVSSLVLILCLLIRGSLDISLINFLSQAETNSEFGTSDENSSSIYIIKKGDTLSQILAKEKILTSDAQDIIRLANEHDVSSSLQIGQEITFEYDISLLENENSDLTQEERTLTRIWFPIDKLNSMEFVRTDNGFIAKQVQVQLTKMLTKYETEISNSFIESLKKVGLSTNAIIELVNTYSHQIDFQRQIRSGDKITVITEKFVTDDSKLSHHGKIIYAGLISQGNHYEIYRYSPEGSEKDQQFFGSDGQSIKSTLLKTPVNVARISSHYGFRERHPVLGYGKMHKGVDFSAPIGTPIYSAGTGVVDFIGWKSGYGKFIVIKHGNNLSTAYAHASRFANDLRKGMRVKQGQVIAYVGQTGQTTGPHLHYEILIDGKQVNPMKFKSTPGLKLSGKQLAKFNKFKSQVSSLSKKLDTDELIASEIKEINLF